MTAFFNVKVWNEQERCHLDNTNPMIKGAKTNII